MKGREYRFTLDVHKQGIQYTLSALKNETGSTKAIISLCENANPYLLQDDNITVVTVSALKPDGKKVLNDCAIIGNCVVVEITAQMLAAVGDVICELELSSADADGALHVIATPRFKIDVGENLQDSLDIVSTDEYQTLHRELLAIGDLEKLRDDMQGSAAAAANSATESSDCAALAEQYKNAAKQSADTAGIYKSTAAQSATNAYNSAAAASQYKDMASQSARDAANSSTTAGEYKDAAAQSAAAAANSAQAAENAKLACLALGTTELTGTELDVTASPQLENGFYKAAQNMKLVRAQGETENFYIPKDAVFSVFVYYDSEIGGDYTYYEVQLLNGCLLGEVGETISPYSTGNRYFYARVSIMGSIEYTFASTLATKRETTQAIKGLEQKLNTAVLTGAQQFCGALTGLSNGEILCLNNISPVEHQIELTAGSKNLLNLTLAKSAQFFTVTEKTENKICATAPNAENKQPVLNLFNAKLPAGTYTLSCSISLENVPDAADNVDTDRRNEILVFKDGTFVTKTDTITADGTYFKQLSFTLPAEATVRVGWYRNVCNIKPDDSLYKVTLSNVQLEFGETATAYTPYLASLAGVRVTRYGKNLFNPATAELTDAQKTANGVTFTAASGSVDVKLPAGTYSISFKRNKNGLLYLRNGKTESGYFSQIGAAETSATFNYTAETDGYLRISSFTTGLELANLQIERASAATAYEPFTAKVYTADPNGSFAGITSLYPVTTLLPGSTGVRLTAKYNKDINKAFAALQQAIISLGGNF